MKAKNDRFRKVIRAEFKSIMNEEKVARGIILQHMEVQEQKEEWLLCESYSEKTKGKYRFNKETGEVERDGDNVTEEFYKWTVVAEKSRTFLSKQAEKDELEDEALQKEIAKRQKEKEQRQKEKVSDDSRG